jgi:hypothetical protein
MARHVCAKDSTGAVALRAALELAVQLGRGDEVNRQAEMANPTKRRDSLQRELHELSQRSQKYALKTPARYPRIALVLLLGAYLAMFCNSATFTAIAFPSHSPPCR